MNQQCSLVRHEPTLATVFVTSSYISVMYSKYRRIYSKLALYFPHTKAHDFKNIYGLFRRSTQSRMYLVIWSLL